MLFKCIFLIVYTFFCQFIVYKIMKIIDKKERQKLRIWEDELIDELIEHRKKLKDMPNIEEKVTE